MSMHFSHDYTIHMMILYIEDMDAKQKRFLINKQDCLVPKSVLIMISVCIVVNQPLLPPKQPHYFGLWLSKVQSVSYISIQMKNEPERILTLETLEHSLSGQ